MNLHPYDGKQRRFRHDDADPAEGTCIVERILRIDLPRPIPELRYELSFYSGGIGVIDHIWISLLTGDTATLIANLGFAAQLTPDICELVDDDVAGFIAGHRAPFQPAPAPDAAVWFDAWSGVNHWELAYVQAGWLHVIAYDQG